MKKVLIIQSVSDLITNSSSEVFLFENSDALKDFFAHDKFYGGTDVRFETIDQVKEFVKENSYLEAIDTLTEWIGSDWLSVVAGLEKYKSFDEIFDFYKFKFEGLVGKTMVVIDNNYSSDLLDKLSCYEKENNTSFNLLEHESY